MPIVARSKSFYRWLKNEGVSLFELVDERYKAFKTEFRTKYKESLRIRLKARGIKAGFGALFIGIVALIAQAGVSPPWNFLLPLMVSASGAIVDKIYVAVVIDPRIRI